MSTDGKRIPRVIVRESRGGRGVFARRDLQAGEILLEYKGEYVDQQTAFSRSVVHRFLLGLDDGRLIDGDRRGNTARWINHSCSPNCVTVERKGRVFIQAFRTIRGGKEVTIDHALGVAGVITPSMRARFVCCCGAQSCRGTKLVALGERVPDVSATDRTRTSRQLPEAPQVTPAQIRILERLSRNRISVSWRQPGRACYCEQIWLSARANVAGICALSLASFEPGAQVFLPTGEPRPQNCDERILAEAVTALDNTSAASQPGN